MVFEKKKTPRISPQTKFMQCKDTLP